MELVPIIQHILTIVAILAIVTLLLSYISFKVRQKKRPDQVYEKNQLEHMEPSFIGRSIRRITRITKEIIPLTPTVQINKVKQEQVINKERVTSKRLRQVNDKKQEQSRELPKLKRIEVMRNISDQNNEAVKSTVPKGKNDNAVNSLGDDILAKYSDSEDQSLFTLKTNKKDN